jgi:hypothetical protein
MPMGNAGPEALPLRGATPEPAMLVDVQISSINTSRAGSRSSWFSNQASRRLRTSGRSCSVAWSVFFERQAVAVEEGPDRADRGLDPRSRPASRHGHVGLRLEASR